MTDPDDLLLVALTPLGFRIRVTRQHWELIVHDREGQTPTVWFTDPSLEHVS